MDNLCKGKAPKISTPTSLQNLQLGLKTLVYPENPSNEKYYNHPRIIHSCFNNLSLSSPSSAPSFLISNSLSLMDDLIGAESGVCLSSNINDENKAYYYNNNENYNIINDGNIMKRNKKSTRDQKKEYPPPIPLLAQTGKLQGRMPWVLKRHYIDGKLLINVERVKHHEYFETHREDGRLLLNLVPLDNQLHQFIDDQEDNIGDHDDQVIEGGEVDNEEDDVMILGHSCNSDELTEEKSEKSSRESVRDSRVAVCNTNVHEQINCTYLVKPSSLPLRQLTTVV